MTHIQKMAPGPPETMAVATPTMLPVPMVPASAVHMLWNWLMAMSSLLVWAVTSLLVNTAPMVCRIQWPTRRNWKPPVRNVIHRPVQNSSASPMGPQTMPLTTPLIFVIHSTIRFPLYTQKPSGTRAALFSPSAPRILFFSQEQLFAIRKLYHIFPARARFFSHFMLHFHPSCPEMNFIMV